MFLDTIHFQRTIIGKIYRRSKKANFEQSIIIKSLHKNEDKLMYFLFDLEDKGFVKIINYPTLEQGKYNFSLFNGLLTVTPHEVMLTEKGKQFFPMLLNSYFEIFVKSILLPILTSIVTTAILHFFLS